jgi:hypothetical protein
VHTRVLSESRHVNKRLRALTGAKIADTANDRNSGIGFIPKSSPSEGNDNISESSGQLRFSERNHRPTIAHFTASPAVQFTFPESRNLMLSLTIPISMHISKPQHKTQHSEQWHPKRVIKMKPILHLMTLNGTAYKLKLQWYWLTSAILLTSVSSGTMEINRFELILRHLHFKDNTTANNNNHRLYKNKPYC